jgi:hypothetical protein
LPGYYRSLIEPTCYCFASVLLIDWIWGALWCLSFHNKPMLPFKHKIIANIYMFWNVWFCWRGWMLGISQCLCFVILFQCA